jgi:hypothetical protein
MVKRQIQTALAGRLLPWCIILDCHISFHRLTSSISSFFRMTTVHFR